MSTPRSGRWPPSRRRGLLEPAAGRNARTGREGEQAGRVLLRDIGGPAPVAQRPMHARRPPLGLVRALRREIGADAGHDERDQERPLAGARRDPQGVLARRRWRAAARPRRARSPRGPTAPGGRARSRRLAGRPPASARAGSRARSTSPRPNATKPSASREPSVPRRLPRSTSSISAARTASSQRPVAHATSPTWPPSPGGSTTARSRRRSGGPRGGRSARRRSP